MLTCLMAAQIALYSGASGSKAVMLTLQLGVGSGTTLLVAFSMHDLAGIKPDSSIPFPTFIVITLLARLLAAQQ